MEKQKKVYPYPADYARQNGELALYRESGRLNRECAKAINDAIQTNNYALYRYDLKAAVQTVVDEYGFERMNWVLANTLWHYDYDGRFSRDNKEWAKGFAIPSAEYNDFLITTHPAVLDGFIDQARMAVLKIEKEDALPGPTIPDIVHGYTVLQYVVFDNDRGFALAHNPNAPQPFVTWQLTEEQGKRDYYWGRYTVSEGKAREDYAVRISDYRSSFHVEERVPAKRSVLGQLKAARDVPHAPKDENARKALKNKSKGDLLP